MAWFALATITPDDKWQITEPVESGIVRVKHVIRGQPTNPNQELTLRVSGQIALAAQILGFVMISQPQRLRTRNVWEVFRFNPLPDQDLTRVGVWAPFNMIENLWRIELEYWQ